MALGSALEGGQTTQFDEVLLDLVTATVPVPVTALDPPLAPPPPLPLPPPPELPPVVVDVLPVLVVDPVAELDVVDAVLPVAELPLVPVEGVRI